MADVWRKIAQAPAGEVRSKAQGGRCGEAQRSRLRAALQGVFCCARREVFETPSDRWAFMAAPAPLPVWSPGRKTPDRTGAAGSIARRKRRSVYLSTG